MRRLLHTTRFFKIVFRYRRTKLHYIINLGLLKLLFNGKSRYRSLFKQVLYRYRLIRHLCFRWTNLLTNLFWRCHKRFIDEEGRTWVELVERLSVNTFTLLVTSFRYMMWPLDPSVNHLIQFIWTLISQINLLLLPPLNWHFTSHLIIRTLSPVKLDRTNIYRTRWPWWPRAS